MAGATILARRDTSGAHVRCGRIYPNGHACGQELLLPGGYQMRPDFRLGPDGVWAETSRARQRRQHSRIVASGNPRQSPRDANFERERLRHGDEGGNRRRHEGPEATRRTVIRADMLVRCPRCGGINSLKDAMGRLTGRDAVKRVD